MTAIAVISDTMLLPYYPELFKTRFGISAPLVTGAYLATISLTVMLALPLWALIAQKTHTLNMLVMTQLAAAALSLVCYFSTDIASFWVASLVMISFKASYLLMYPYVMSMVPAEKHGNTIGALAVIVHLGGIIGALSGGLLVERLNFSAPFIAMAAGDIAQALICIFLISAASMRIPPKDAESMKASTHPENRELRAQFAFLLVAMFFFYFGFYTAIPFTTVWWHAVVADSSQLVAGAVFAIPGLVAFVMLLGSCVAKNTGQPWYRNESGMALTAAGLALQSFPDATVIVVGRIVYGVGLYRVTVGLDALFFNRAHEFGYASGFSLVNIARNSGVMAATFLSGVLVQQFGDGLSFLAASVFVAATLVFYRLYLKPSIPANNQTTQLV